MKIRELLTEDYHEVPLLFMTEEKYDEAIVGVSCMCQGTSNNFRVVYDVDKVIEINMADGMTYEEAEEYYSYNQGDAYMGDNTPIFVKLKENMYESS